MYILAKFNTFSRSWKANSILFQYFQYCVGTLFSILNRLKKIYFQTLSEWKMMEVFPYFSRLCRHLHIKWWCW